MASAEKLRERTVICSESIEAFKVLSPDLLRDISMASKPQIQVFFKVITTLIQSPDESPGKKFYSLYLLLKASETNPNQDFLDELAAKEDLISFVFFTAQTDMSKDIEFSQRGKTYFLKNPTQTEATMGINFIRLCLEVIIYWGKYFGKKDQNDPRHTFWKKLNSIMKRGAEIPLSYLFIGKDYQGKSEIASWNFEKMDLPSIPYKPADLNAARNDKSASMSEAQEEKVINIKRVTYQEDLQKERQDSRANLDRILKSESSDLSPSPVEKVSPALQKSPQLAESLTDTKYSRKEEMLKKHGNLGEAGSKTNFETGAQRSKPSSRIFEDNPRSKSANLLADQPDPMKKVNNDLDTSLNNSYSSRGGYQNYEGRVPTKKLTFGSRMTEEGIFREEGRSPTSERRKSPAGTQIQNTGSPQRRDGSPMTVDLKASTDNIRNFFNERDKQQQPNRVPAKAWETNQSSPSKMFSADSTPQFIRNQSGKLSKSPELEQKSAFHEKSKGFEEAAVGANAGETGGLTRKGPVSRSGNPVETKEGGRRTSSNVNVDEGSPTEVKILTKQIESFRNENSYLMNEIQRYQDEFKRRMELEKLLIKENNSLKATIANSNQQAQEMNLTMTELYDKNQKLARELQEAKNQIEFYKGSRK